MLLVFNRIDAFSVGCTQLVNELNSLSPNLITLTFNNTFQHLLTQLPFKLPPPPSSPSPQSLDQPSLQFPPMAADRTCLPLLYKAEYTTTTKALLFCWSLYLSGWWFLCQRTHCRTPARTVDWLATYNNCVYFVDTLPIFVVIGSLQPTTSVGAAIP